MKAYTIIEVVIVIAIIAILTIALGPQFVDLHKASQEECDCSCFKYEGGLPDMYMDGYILDNKGKK